MTQRSSPFRPSSRNTAGSTWTITLATGPKFIQGHLGVVRSVAGGESLATFDMMLHHTMVEKSEGKPIDVIFPESDAIPIWGQLGAIFKDAPHPNAAKLYLQWYMGKEQQQRIGTWSARNDVPPPFGLKPILSYNVATIWPRWSPIRRSSPLCASASSRTRERSRTKVASADAGPMARNREPIDRRTACVGRIAARGG